MSSISLLQPLAEVPIAVVDVETTGASASLGDRVIEIGIVRIEGGRIVATYEGLIDPGRPIGAGVTALTGISQAMVEGQPRFADRLGEFLPLLRGAAVLGHNIRFDLSFLHREFRRAGLDIGQTLGHGGRTHILDTVRVARRRFGRGGNSLGVLSRRLGIDPVISHRALADARTTALLFEALMQPVGGWQMMLLAALSEQGGPIELARCAGPDLLPWELEEALELRRPVMMQYVDAQGAITQRVVEPLHVRRRGGELVLVAHCQLRDDRRTFKVDRIVRLARIDELPAGAPAAVWPAPVSSSPTSPAESSAPSKSSPASEP